MYRRRWIWILAPVAFLALAAWLLARERNSWKPQLLVGAQEDPGYLALSPDGRWLSLGQRHELLNLEDGRRRKVEAQGIVSDFSPDGRYFSSLEESEDDKEQTARIFDFLTGKLVGKRTFHCATESGSCSLGFAPPQGPKGLCSEYVTFVEGRLERWSLPDLIRGRAIPLGSSVGKDPSLWASNFAAQNARLVVPELIGQENAFGAQPLRLRIFDTDTGKLTKTSDLPAARDGNPNPVYLGVGGEFCVLDPSKQEVAFVDVRLAKSLWTVKPTGSLSISPDGSLVLTVDEDDPRRFAIREALTGRIIHKTWPTPARLIYDVCFEPDGNSVVTSDQDGAVYRLRIR